MRRVRCERSGCGSVDVGRQCLAGNLDEAGEGLRVGHGDVGEHLAVNLDTRGLEALDEAVVGDVVGAGRSVDTRDPCLLYTSPSPRDRQKSRMPSSA